MMLRKLLIAIMLAFMLALPAHAAQYDFGTINTTTTSGDDLAVDLQNWRDALNSTYSGTSAPSYKTAGTIWLDTTSSSLWLLKQYDGSTSVTLGSIDTTGHKFTPYFNGAAAGSCTGEAIGQGLEDDGSGNLRVKLNGTTLSRSSSGMSIASGGVSSSQIASNAVTNSLLATMAANTVKANATGSSATPTDVALSTSQFICRGSTGNIAACSIGTGLSMSGTTLSASGSGGAAGDIQTFTGSGTWTKPSGTITHVECWGAGGGSAAAKGAGGGGGYKEGWFATSGLGATETVTIGAGGSTSGGNGGNTTFGSWLTAYGGGGSSSFTSGGGGGGLTSAGGAAASNTVGANGGGPNNPNNGLGGNNSDGGSSFSGGGGGAGASNDGGDAVWGGGGGSGSGAIGGNSIYGGGGGGAGSGATAGKSVFGGNGGASANGSQPGGGGGSTNAAGKSGGAGECIVTTF